jgi:MFS family permease
VKTAESACAGGDRLDRQVWILAAGRLLSMIGIGFTTFYAPVHFVNTMHIPATLVGLGFAANSLAGTGARIAGGSLSDSARFGRRLTLLASATVLGTGSIMMGLLQNFWWFVASNTLLGFGAGLYWPAVDAMIADITTQTNRRDAFAVSRFADYCGLAVGILLAGLIIQHTGAFQLLFFAGAASYFLLAAVIIFAVRESRHAGESPSLFKSWAQALRDPLLQLYVIANVLMTAYVTQITSSLPLYLSDRIKVAPGQSLTPWLLSSLFAVHIILLAVCQIPVTRAMNRFSAARSLMLSCAIWFVGFLAISVCGLISSFQLYVAVAALVLMSIATAAYAPPASALIADFAPQESLAIYFSINSLCWAIGGMAGPPLVLTAMDHFQAHTPFIWLVMAASTLIPAAVFQALSKKAKGKPAPATSCHP